MEIKFSDVELIALVKALTFVKFVSTDYDAKELAGSPYIGEIYKRVGEAAGEYYKSVNIPFPNEWPFIESIKGYLKIVKVHIEHTSNWKDLQPDQCEEFIKTLVYPYRMTGETIQELKEYGDNVHA